MEAGPPAGAAVVDIRPLLCCCAAALIVVCVIAAGALFLTLSREDAQQQRQVQPLSRAPLVRKAPPTSAVSSGAAAAREGLTRRLGRELDPTMYNTASSLDVADESAEAALLLSSIDSDQLRHIYESVGPEEVRNTQLLLESFAYDVQDLVRYEHEFTKA